MILDPYGGILAGTWKAGDEMVVADLDASLLKVSTNRHWIKTRRPELYEPLAVPTGVEQGTRTVRFDKKGIWQRKNTLHRIDSGAVRKKSRGPRQPGQRSEGKHRDAAGVGRMEGVYGNRRSRGATEITLEMGGDKHEHRNDDHSHADNSVDVGLLVEDHCHSGHLFVLVVRYHPDCDEPESHLEIGVVQPR
jgi:hypothetical protein